MNEHGGRMLAVARRMLRNDEEARDAVQEAFLLAFRGLPRFAGQSRLGTWLHRIVVNAALMKLRSRRARPEESIEPLLPTFLEDGHSTRTYRDWPESADRLLERAEVREPGADGDRPPAGDLPHRPAAARHRGARHRRGRARCSSISANAVKIRLHRARQALRELLDPHLRQGEA